MKRKFCLIVIYSCWFNLLIFSQENIDGKVFTLSPDITYHFKDEKLSIFKYDYNTMKTEIKNVVYRQEYIEFIPYIILKAEASKRYLSLFDDRVLLLYDNENAEPLAGGYWGRVSHAINTKLFDIETSLSYRSKQELYPITNIFSLKLSEPWVEGVAGSGEGEWIIIQPKEQYAEAVKIIGFYFSNGYVSYDKPYLYTYNNRVRSVKISDLDGNNEKTINLFDTPNLQYITLEHEYKSLKISILQTYDGSHFDDTCINFLVPILK